MIVHSDSPDAWMPSGEGAHRRILCEGPDLMMVSFRFDTGGFGLPHHHPHVQSTYVTSGEFEFTISDQTQRMGPGDAVLIPANAVHSCKCIQAGQLIDAFTPRRDDFLEAHAWPTS